MFVCFKIVKDKCLFVCLLLVFFQFQAVLDKKEKEGNVLFNDALNTFYLRSFMVLLYASSHRHNNTYHGLCYTSHGALAGTRNRSMGPP